MNDQFSHLSLTDLYDKLSECTGKYSKSMINGISPEKFSELSTTIHELQREIAKRKAESQNSTDSSHTIYPPQESESA